MNHTASSNYLVAVKSFCSLPSATSNTVSMSSSRTRCSASANSGTSQSLSIGLMICFANADFLSFCFNAISIFFWTVSIFNNNKMIIESSTFCKNYYIFWDTLRLHVFLDAFRIVANLLFGFLKRGRIFAFFLKTHTRIESLLQHNQKPTKSTVANSSIVKALDGVDANSSKRFRTTLSLMWTMRTMSAIVRFML